MVCKIKSIRLHKRKTQAVKMPSPHIRTWSHFGIGYHKTLSPEEGEKYQGGSGSLQAWPETGSWWQMITVLERAHTSLFSNLFDTCTTMHTYTFTQMGLCWTVFRTSFQVSRLCLLNKVSKDFTWCTSHCQLAYSKYTWSKMVLQLLLLLYVL